MSDINRSEYVAQAKVNRCELFFSPYACGMNPSATLGAWLDAHAIPQAEMGRVFNVSAVTVHYWVTGDRKPSHQRALAIEAWTSGAIPAVAWLDDAARKDSEALAAIEPYAAGPEK